MKKIQTQSRLWPWLMVASLSALTAACGGGDDGGRAPILGAGDVNAVMAPTVTVVTPLSNATGVPLATRAITAAFSEAMDPATLTPTSFTLACPAPTAISGGLVSYLASSQTATLTFPLASTLPVNTVCTATVTSAVKDSTGVAMVNPSVWQFTTAAAPDTIAPTVASTVNANNATNVAINTKVGATFSEAMNPSTINQNSLTLKQGATPVLGTTSYSGTSAVFAPTEPLDPNTLYTATVASTAADLAGNTLTSNYVWSWTTGAASDTTAPTVASTAIADNATGVAFDTKVLATFSEAMNPLSLTNTTFAVAEATSGAVVAGALNYSGVNATFVPQNKLALNTRYTVTVKGGVGGVEDLAGNVMQSAKVWSFTTAAAAVLSPAIDLISATTYGTLGGTAGMTNTGIQTRINGDIGTIATGTSMITGFHDTSGDFYTETPANIGAVNGKILTCTNSITGPTKDGVNAASCALATQARLDAQTAYNALAAMPVTGANPGANLANLTLQAGTYNAPAGSFLIEGGNLTLDAQGNANAIWVFQMATTLTVGGPGAAAPQSIILAGGAQAKNVFWQVGSFATINAAGGGTMVGTILSQAGAAFSTAGNTNIVTLNGRVLSLDASVTLVDTVINVPAP